MNSRRSYTDRPRRRQFLQLAVVGTIGGFAGCLDGSDDEPTDDEPTDDEPTDDEPTDDEPTSEPELRDVLNWESSYVMELAVPLGSGTITVYDGDTYTAWTINGVEMEAYRIGTDEYIVVDEECFIPTGSSDEDIFEPERLIDEFGSVTATKAEPIDGQDVYRFEVDDGYLYVRTDSGYPIRFESKDASGATDFHSWGEPDPISPPDMDCVEQ
ncbi:hypothetical protein [Natronorubrum sp. A-ect3]|uniref:hypothetical protein n=1 Tax=Natronorubrum sp. A-ect3 TaxID=3242698 RepID=UPI00359DCEB1